VTGSEGLGGMDKRPLKGLQMILKRPNGYYFLHQLKPKSRSFNSLILGSPMSKAFRGYANMYGIGSPRLN
jgi:hypothetical protein